MTSSIFLMLYRHLIATDSFDNYSCVIKQMCTPHPIDDGPACHGCITTLRLVRALKSHSLHTCRRGEICLAHVRQRREYLRKCIENHTVCHITSCHFAMQARLHETRACMMHRCVLVSLHPVRLPSARPSWQFLAVIYVAGRGVAGKNVQRSRTQDASARMDAACVP